MNKRHYPKRRAHKLFLWNLALFTTSPSNLFAIFSKHCVEFDFLLSITDWPWFEHEINSSSSYTIPNNGKDNTSKTSSIFKETSSSINQIIKTSALIDSLVGVEIAESWKDKDNNYYSLAILNK